MPLSLTYLGVPHVRGRSSSSSARRETRDFMALKAIEAVFNPHHHGVETPILPSYLYPCFSPTFRPHPHPLHATRPFSHDPRSPPEPYAVKLHFRRNQGAFFLPVFFFLFTVSWRTIVTPSCAFCVPRTSCSSSTPQLRHRTPLRRAIQATREHLDVPCLANKNDYTFRTSRY